MRRFYIVGVIVIAALGAAAYGLFNRPVQPVQPVESVQPRPASFKVGAVIPLTGPGAELGKLIKRGLELGEQQVNSRADGPKIEIQFEDSKTSPTEGLTVFRRFVDIQRTPVVLVAFSAVCNAVAPAAEETDALMVGVTTSMPGLTGGRTHVIRLFPNVDSLAGTMADYATSKFRRVAILYAEDEYGRSTYKTFASRFAADGREVVFAESFKPAEVEFRTTVGKMLEHEPDAIYLPGYGPGYIALLRQIRERNADLPIMADSPLTNPAVYRAAGDAALGAIVPATPLDAGIPESEAQKQFLDHYRQQFNENPSINVTINYDFVMILADALKTTNRSPEEIRSHFLGLAAYHGLTGEIQYLPDGESVVHVRPMRITKDGIRQIEE